jgi:hypothetical protein
MGRQPEITRAVEEPDGDVGTMKKRLRAMSDSVGGLFGKVTGKRTAEDKTDGDDDAGISRGNEGDGGTAFSSGH